MLYENAIGWCMARVQDERRTQALLAAIALGQILGLVGCHNCEGPGPSGRARANARIACSSA